MTEYLIFTNNWWNWFFHEYAFTVALLFVLLKGLALLDPTNHSNEILDSLRSLFNTGQSLNRRMNDRRPDPPKK